MQTRKLITYLLLFNLIFPGGIFADGSDTAAELSQIHLNAPLGGEIERLFSRWGGLQEKVPHSSRPDHLGAAIRLGQEVFVLRDGKWTSRDLDALYASDRVHPNVLDPEQLRVLGPREILTTYPDLVGSGRGRFFALEQRGMKGPNALHVFRLHEEDGEIESVVMDREFVRVFTTKGKLFSVSMLMARSGLFNHRIPLVLNISLPEDFHDEGTTQIMVVSRAKKPPEGIHLASSFFTTAKNQRFKGSGTEFPPELELEAGDMLLLSAQRECMGHFDSELLRTQHFLATEAVMLSLVGGSSDPQLARLRHEMKALQVVSQLQADSIQNPPEYDRFLFNEWAPTFAKIKGAAVQHLKRLEEESPKTRLAAVARAYAEPRARRNAAEPRIDALRAGIQNGDLSSFWRYTLETPKPNENLVNWLTSGKRPWFLAAGIGMVTGLTAAVSMGYHGSGPEWFQILSAGIASWIPNVLLENPPNWSHSLDYWCYLIPSAAFLGLLSVPLMQTIGAISAHRLGGRNRGIDFKRGLGQFSQQLYSRITGAWYLAVDRMPRLPTFSTALREGLSPLTRIDPESPIGRRLGLRESIRLGMLNDPENLQRSEAIDLRTRAIGELVMNKERGYGIAMLLSLYELTLSLAPEGITSPQDLFQRIRNKSEVKSAAEREKIEGWERTLKEKTEERWAAVDVLLSQEEYFKEASEMAGAELEALHRRIEEIRKNLKSSGGLTKAARASRKWFVQKSIPWLASWGIWSQGVLRNNMITQTIADQTWLSSRTDILFGIGLTSLVGGRANYGELSQLAADPSKPWFGFTSGPNFSDSFEQTMIYAIASGARDFLLWYVAEPLYEDRYAPIESVLVDGTINDRVRPTMEEVRDGFRALFSLRGLSELADTMWSSSVTNRIEFIWASILLGLLPRIVLADKSLGEAFVGDMQALLTCVGFNAFWWIVYILNFGAKGNAASNRQKLVAAIVAIERGETLKDGALKDRGYSALAELYSICPTELRPHLELALKLMNVDEAKKMEKGLEVEQFQAELLKVWKEIEDLKAKGLSLEMIVEKYSQEAERTPELKSLRGALEALQQRMQTVSTNLIPMGAEDLAESAKKNPPVETKANWVFPELMVWIVGAVGSNIAGSFIMADSYANASWGKLAVLLVLYFPVLWSVKWSLQKGLPLARSQFESLRFRWNQWRHGPEFARERELKRRLRALEKEMQRRSENHPLHPCTNQLGSLATQ